MATTKKTVAPTPAAKKSIPPAREKKSSRSKKPSHTPVLEKSSEELVVENFADLTRAVDMLSETLEMLVEKTESMAYHVIATEEVLAEVVAANGLNLARVNARIRAKIAAGTDGSCDSNRAIDVAAAIASPLSRR